MSPSEASPENIKISSTTAPTVIRNLALATWYPTYHEILATEQIEYMLSQVYSLEALQEQMTQGQTFLLLTDQDVPAAFAAYSCLDAGSHLYKLYKLYIHPEFQKKGYGKRLLQEVTNRVQQAGGLELELNVHRQNPAFHFYVKHGFRIHKIVDLPFGPFTLNDYILRLIVPKPADN